VPVLDENPDLSVYAINFREDGDPKAYLEENGYNFTLLLDGEGVAESYGVWGTPGVIIFDADNQRIFNLYDVLDQYDPGESQEGLSHRQKAARKAPWYGEQIRSVLADL
jgi:hypothetical protein